MKMLLIGGAKLNPCPPAGQEKTDQILTHGRKQEKECKMIKSLLDLHNQEIAEIKSGTKAPG
jgi:hypothetical protein